MEERVTLPVYAGIDYSVEHIFEESAGPLIVFASLLTLWHVSRGVRVVMKALNVIHDAKEERTRWRQLGIDFVLALTLSVSIVGAFLVVTFLPRLAEGAASLGLQVVAWLAAAVLFGFAVGVLIRYAPAERPETRWASAGSLLVVSGWVVTSVVFGWWAGSVASYKSAIGSLTVFLVLTAYVLASTTIFLAGAQLDELARKGGRR